MLDVILPACLLIVILLAVLNFVAPPNKKKK
jgi:hypothetical protein